jgi:hypothetical protein
VIRPPVIRPPVIPSDGVTAVTGGPHAGRPLGSRHAQRLLRWYPRSWRARYGEEFAELLIAEFAEQPRSWRRAADVARGGLLARLTSAGLTDARLAGGPLDPAAGLRASLATLACSAAVFLTVGATLWAQLTVSWEWAPPATQAAAVAMGVMSAAMLLLAVLAFLAAVPVAAAAALARVRGQAPALGRPILLIGVGALTLVLGGRHFGNAWPGTGGHWWLHQGLVPGGVAAFSWACTLSVTSYWAHPAALASFPAAELAWMAVSPVAMLGLVTGAAQVVRRVRLSPRVLRHEVWVGSAALVGMAAFAGGALCWVIERGPEPQRPGPQGLFRAGRIDAAGLAVMIIALVIGWQARQRARRGGPPVAARPAARR